MFIQYFKVDKCPLCHPRHHNPNTWLFRGWLYSLPQALNSYSWMKLNQKAPKRRHICCVCWGRGGATLSHWVEHFFTVGFWHRAKLLIKCTVIKSKLENGKKKESQGEKLLFGWQAILGSLSLNKARVPTVQWTQYPCWDTSQPRGSRLELETSLLQV